MDTSEVADEENQADITNGGDTTLEVTQTEETTEVGAITLNFVMHVQHVFYSPTRRIIVWFSIISNTSKLSLLVQGLLQNVT